MDPKANSERYQRQVLLRQFGLAGQQKLLQARVLMIGAGGLGCPVLQYFSAAGVGHIGIVDGDVVSISNLHRQVLYTEQDIGRLKAEIARKRLLEMNPDIQVTIHPIYISPENALEILREYEIIIDGTDNFATRYMINDACILLDKILVYGAIAQFEGQVAIFNHSSSVPAVNYRDLFPHPPSEGELLNCAEAGVLGVLPGIIGTMMANETIKLIAGIGKPLIHQVLTYNALTNATYTIGLQAAPGTRALIPKDAATFRETNYEWLCRPIGVLFEIDGDRFRELLESRGVVAIDVRETGEIPEVTAFLHQHIPLSVFKDRMAEITADTVLLFCQSGRRSLQAAQQLADYFGSSKSIYSLQGGILQYEYNKET
jgi:molybdopterin/thiamine biosynthesis adenylyltransferase/rhodanese-related sulfurtransferase